MLNIKMQSNVIPVPTSADEGKVPTVQSDGSYALANAGGGTEPLTVVFSAATGTATMTPAQVFSAVNNEQDVKAKFTNKYDYVGDGIVSVNKRLGDPLVSILFLRYPNATQGGEIWCIRFYGTQNATTWSVSSFKLPAT